MSSIFIELEKETPFPVYASQTGGAYRQKGKLGDGATFSLYFMLSGVLVDPPTATYIEELKNPSQYQSDPLVRVTEFLEKTDSSGQKFLEIAPDWHSESVVEILEPGGSRQPRQLHTMAEFSWLTPEGAVVSTETFETLIVNDVVKEFTSPPVPLPEAPWPTSNVNSYDGEPLPDFQGVSLNDVIKYISDLIENASDQLEDHKSNQKNAHGMPPSAEVVEMLDNMIVTPAVAAVGELTLTGSVSHLENVVVGVDIIYFQDAGSPVIKNTIYMVAPLTSADAATSIKEFVNGEAPSVAGVTFANRDFTELVTASVTHGASTVMTVTANVAGVAANGIATTETLANGSWGDVTLTGGVDQVLLRPGSIAGMDFITLTQAEYDAIPIPDSNTIYNII